MTTTTVGSVIRHKQSGNLYAVVCQAQNEPGYFGLQLIRDGRPFGPYRAIGRRGLRLEPFEDVPSMRAVIPRAGYLSGLTVVEVEPEYCDDCGEVVGHYDPSMPEGEKIVLTTTCGCWR